MCLTVFIMWIKLRKNILKCSDRNASLHNRMYNLAFEEAGDCYSYKASCESAGVLSYCSTSFIFNVMR